MEVLRAHNVEVGISLDGPKDVHDASRVDHKQGSSYDAVRRGLDHLLHAGIPVGVLAVLQLGEEGLRIHRHFLQLGLNNISYLLPHFTHDTIESVREKYGPTPCADFLLPILEDWWSNGTLALRIGLFWNLAHLILGGKSRIDCLGNRPFHFVFVEADGSIQGLTALAVCREGLASTGLNVTDNDFTDMEGASEFHQAAIFDGLPLPTGCREGPERTTCGGGYLPNRYSMASGFDNPTIWCQDILRLFGRLRQLLNVTVHETAQRRKGLAETARPDTSNAGCGSGRELLRLSDVRGTPGLTRLELPLAE
jgi:uncharacterized protein